VHGANFSFWVSTDGTKVAGRSSFLENGDESFYACYLDVVEENREKIKKLFNLSNSKNMTVFGELFGGVYPHEEVPKVKNAMRIQKGINYAPFNQFYAFDLVLDGEYVSVDTANELFEQSGIFYAKTVYRGSFEDCLKHSNEFSSKIPGYSVFLLQR